MVKAAVAQAFARRVLAWYDRHKRDLPWRKTKNPYRILVSEIMLQQTQVDRVIPKYREFLAKYPDLKTLAGAEAREVKKIWYPLGYNARPLRLHALAGETLARFGGRLPRTPDELVTLPGIGRYTAGAVASIAFNRREAALDTNIRRVLNRVQFGSRPVSDRRLWAVASALVPADRPGDFNQALMDLGSAVCTARKPECPKCPVRGVCKFMGRKAPSPPKPPLSCLRRDAERPHRERGRKDA